MNHPSQYQTAIAQVQDQLPKPQQLSQFKKLELLHDLGSVLIPITYNTSTTTQATIDTTQDIREQYCVGTFHYNSSQQTLSLFISYHHDTYVHQFSPKTQSNPTQSGLTVNLIDIILQAYQSLSLNLTTVINNHFKAIPYAKLTACLQDKSAHTAAAAQPQIKQQITTDSLEEAAPITKRQRHNQVKTEVLAQNAETHLLAAQFPSAQTPLTLLYNQNGCYTGLFDDFLNIDDIKQLFFTTLQENGFCLRVDVDQFPTQQQQQKKIVASHNKNKNNTNTKNTKTNKKNNKKRIVDSSDDDFDDDFDLDDLDAPTTTTNNSNNNDNDNTMNTTSAPTLYITKFTQGADFVPYTQQIALSPLPHNQFNPAQPIAINKPAALNINELLAMDGVLTRMQNFDHTCGATLRANEHQYHNMYLLNQLSETKQQLEQKEKRIQQLEHLLANSANNPAMLGDVSLLDQSTGGVLDMTANTTMNTTSAALPNSGSNTSANDHIIPQRKTLKRKVNETKKSAWGKKKQTEDNDDDDF